MVSKVVHHFRTKENFAQVPNLQTSACPHSSEQQVRSAVQSQTREVMTSELSSFFLGGFFCPALFQFFHLHTFPRDSAKKLREMLRVINSNANCTTWCRPISCLLLHSVVSTHGLFVTNTSTHAHAHAASACRSRPTKVGLRAYTCQRWRPRWWKGHIVGALQCSGCR